MPHHLLDVADPWDDHDLATYQAAARDVLADIEAYNRVDCDSTRDLRDYLLRLRAAGATDLVAYNDAVSGSPSL